MLATAVAPEAPVVLLATRDAAQTLPSTLHAFFAEAGGDGAEALCLPLPTSAQRLGYFKDIVATVQARLCTRPPPCKYAYRALPPPVCVRGY